LRERERESNISDTFGKIFGIVSNFRPLGRGKVGVREVKVIRGGGMVILGFFAQITFSFFKKGYILVFLFGKMVAWDTV